MGMFAMARTWGSTVAERGRDYPCDRWMDDPDDICFRAIDVAAPPGLAFRWLCQLRAAPYSYDWIDNRGRRSPRTLTPGLDELADGQRVMRIFRLVEHEPGRHLTMVLDSPGGARMFGALALTYEIIPAPGGGCRLVAKMLVRRTKGWFRFIAPLLPAADLVMMRKQLRTLKRLAERDAAGRGVARDGA